MARAKAIQVLDQPEIYRTLDRVPDIIVDCESTQKVSALRLSVITQFFPPDYAATGQLIEELVRHLGSQGIDIKVFAGQPGYAYNNAIAPRVEKKEQLQIVRSRTTQLWGRRVRGKTVSGLLFTLRTALHLLKNCRSRNLVLLTTAPPFLPALGYLANVLLGIPYVCLLYDLYPDIAIELDVISSQHWLSKLWRSINHRVWRNAQELIVLSPSMRSRIADDCPEVADKIHVIHSWADSERITPLEKNENWFAYKYGLVKKFTVLYSGNMGRCHDMETIFNAAKMLRDEPIQFVCIGAGAKRSNLIERVEAAGLDSFVFLPYQDKETLPFSLTACDLSLVSVIPGMESLVAPSKLYSALASGRPIAAVCPQGTYIQDMLKDSSCGETFLNGDSQGLADFILRLSRDSELTEKMGKAARYYIEENFTPELISQQYSDVLHRGFAIASSTKENMRQL